MAKLILTAEVEDTEKWEEGFRTHMDLFKSQTITTMVFGIGEDNTVALYQEIDKPRHVARSAGVTRNRGGDGLRWREARHGQGLCTGQRTRLVVEVWRGVAPRLTVAVPPLPKWRSIL